MSLPDHLDVPLARTMDLPGVGRAELLDGPGLAIAIQAVGARVYDVWVGQGEDWVQLCRDAGRWTSEDRPTGTVRFWIASEEPEPVLPPAPPVQPEVVAYLPVQSGEPPLPAERRPLLPGAADWLDARARDVVVRAMLDEWTAAAAQARSLGWMCGLPRGEDLLGRYAREGRLVDDHDASFGRWLVGEFGRRTRLGLHDRRDAEARRAGVEHLLVALARLLRSLAPALRIDWEVPAVVGPAERHRWLVDGDLARRLGAPGGADVHRPVFVLRPVLLLGDAVLLEGEVV